MENRIEEIDHLTAQLRDLAQGMKHQYQANPGEALRNIRRAAWALYWLATPPPTSPGGTGSTSPGSSKSTPVTTNCPHCSASVTITLS
jgi:hypothetical protein